MKFRTVALALALCFGLTVSAEAAKKKTYTRHATPAKARKYQAQKAKAYKTKRAKASKPSTKLRKHV
jgi:hypothetical protein